jgi:hypothetical protein
MARSQYRTMGCWVLEDAGDCEAVEEVDVVEVAGVVAARACRSFETNPAALRKVSDFNHDLLSIIGSLDRRAKGMLRLTVG